MLKDGGTLWATVSESVGFLGVIDFTACLARMTHVRILTTYPPAFGPPEESLDLTLPLQAAFPSTAAAAHQRILGALAAGYVFEVSAAEHTVPYRFSAGVVWSVVVG